MKKIILLLFAIQSLGFSQNTLKTSNANPIIINDSTFSHNPVIAGGYLISPIDIEIKPKSNINYTNSLLVLGTGVLLMSSSIHRAQSDWHAHTVKSYSNPIDDYLTFAPNALVFGLNIVGVKAKHSFKDRLLVSAMANSIMFATVTGLKYTTKVLRPDGSERNSFPSGHTALAFTGAEIMNVEYGDQSVIYSIGGYAIGGVTGALRMVNNRHWLSDVVAGAGIGMLSAKIAYRLLPWAKKKVFKNENLAILPIYLPNGGGVGMNLSFR